MLPWLVRLARGPHRLSIGDERSLLLLLAGRADLAALTPIVRQDVLLLHLGQVLLVLDHLRGTRALVALLEDWDDVAFHLYCVLLIDVMVLLFDRCLFVQKVLFFGIVLRDSEIICALPILVSFTRAGHRIATNE